MPVPYESVIRRVFVTVFCGFDAAKKLIDVWVWKTRDAL